MFVFGFVVCLLINIVHFFEAVLDPLRPVLIRDVQARKLDCVEAEVALIVQFGVFDQVVVQQGSQLNRRACPRGGREALVTGPSRGAHLVHPGQAVEGIAANYESGVLVD